MSEGSAPTNHGVDGIGATRYDAFISYSHVSDGPLAKALQQGLQRLAHPWYGARALRVFRDATGLGVSPSLWSSICEALDSARYFVLMSSPESAASEWVGREISRWREEKPADRILIVLTAGEIEWVDEVHDFDWERSTALHPALHGAFGDEPLYLDLRWARSDPELTLRHGRFRQAVAELAAPIHGRKLEELEGDDVRERRKLQRATGAGVLVLVLLLVVAVIATFFAFGQRNQARQAATAAEARSLSADSLNEVSTGSTGLAMLLAVAGDRLDPSPSNEAAVLQTLEAEPGLYRDFPMSSGTVGSAAFSSDGRRLAVGDGGVIKVWDVDSGRPIGDPIRPRRALGFGQLAFGDGDRLVLFYVFGNAGAASLDVADPTNGAVLRSIPLHTSTYAASAGSATIAFSSATGNIDVAGARSGAIRTLPVNASQNPPGAYLALSGDGMTVVAAQVQPSAADPSHYVEGVTAWNTTTGELVGSCTGDVGGGFNGSFRMPPEGPTVLSAEVGPADGTVTTFLSGGTRAVVGRCDTTTGTMTVATTVVPTPATAPVTAISADGSVIAARSVLSGSIGLFDGRTGRSIRSEVTEPPLSPGEFGSVILSPDGRLVGAPESGIGELKVWRSRGTDPLVRRLPSDLAGGGSLAALAPDGSTMLVQREQGDFEDVEVVRRDSGHVVVDLPSAVENQARCGLLFNEVQFVGDGRYVASPFQAARGNRCGPASVELWNTSSGGMHKIGVPARACPGAVQSVGLSLDDRILVVGCSTQNLATGFRGRLRGSVARIDVSSPRPRVLSVDPVALSPDSVSVSRDGLVVAVAEEDLAGAGVEVMAVDNGRLRGSPVEFGNGNGVGPVAFAPDGDYVATSFGDGRLELWRTGSTTPERTELMVPGPQGADSLAFSPDSTRLAVGDSKGDVRLWDVASGTALGTLTRQPSSIDDLAFTRRGVLVAASSPSQSSAAPRAYMISLATTAPEWTRAVCGITHRDLSTKQWSQFAPDTPYVRSC